MCRNIRRLYNCVPAADEEAARLAALQYVRKVSGYRKPSVVNEAAFAQAVDEVAAATLRMLAALETKAGEGEPVQRRRGRTRGSLVDSQGITGYHRATASGRRSRVMDRLAGKVAIVTGAGQGLGRETALLFARQGARVLVSDVNADTAAAVTAEITEAGGEALALQADVSKAADAERIAQRAQEHFGGLDILVNNAGIMGYGTVLTANDEDWERIIGINLKGVFLCSRAAIPHMQAGGGSIVCISSISGVMAQSNQAIYNASKHGVIGLVRCMALDFAQDGIRVNAVCPGMMLTPMLTYLPEERLAAAAQANMLKRGGDPAEVAQLVLFLASDEASYITGSIHVADGGETAQ